jgi:hypothetical protein
MTGQNKRSKTFEQIVGLEDKQLSTPKHDEMILWLLNIENLKTIIPELSDWINLIDEAYDEDYKFIKNEVKRIENGEASYYNNDRVLQQFKDYLKKSKPEIIINSEVPIKGNNDFIYGYWDIEVLIRAVVRHIRIGIEDVQNVEVLNEIPERIYIEVKPKIDSFGTTLRQLNTYKSLVEGSSGNIYLFTEDLRFKEQFESQGIKVISPPGKTTKFMI